jgi:recombinational DNA repair ATPase RecF
LGLWHRVPCEYGAFFGFSSDLVAASTAEEDDLSQHNTALCLELQRLDSELHARSSELEQKKKELSQMEQDLAQKSADVAATQAKLQQSMAEITQLQQKNMELQKTVSDSTFLATSLETHKVAMRQHEEAMAALAAQRQRDLDGLLFFRCIGVT